MTKILTFMAVYVCASTQLMSQVTYSIPSETAAPEIIVTGTSTLHGWKATAGEITEYPQSLTLDLTKPSSIESFEFQVAVESLDGGRGSAMNEKIYKAFNSTDNPQIVFSQTQVISLPPLKEGEKVSLNVDGTITMAGQSAAVSLPLDVEIKGNSLVFSGSKPLKMTDYGMTPPSAMFGQIVTDDDIEVQYTFQYIAVD